MNDKLFQSLQQVGFNRPGITLQLANSVALWDFDVVAWLAIHRN